MYSTAMSKARLTHGFVFVSDLDRTIAFYENAFGMTAQRTSDAGYVMMHGVEGASIALHELPADLRAPISQPPSWRSDTAYKLCFAVNDLLEIRAAIIAFGGQAKEPWSWDGATYCDATDPEGNVIQIYSQAESE